MTSPKNARKEVTMKCRTCLHVLDSIPSYSIKTKLMLGKSVEEMILFFTPQMEKSDLVDDFMCSHCMDTVQMFLIFIERCINVDKYLNEKKKTLEKQRKIILSRLQSVNNINKNNATVTEAPQKKFLKVRDNLIDEGKVKKRSDRLRNSLKLISITKTETVKASDQKAPEPPELATTFVKPLRTYSCKKKKTQPPQIIDLLNCSTTKSSTQESEQSTTTQSTIIVNNQTTSHSNSKNTVNRTVVPISNNTPSNKEKSTEVDQTICHTTLDVSSNSKDGADSVVPCTSNDISKNKQQSATGPQPSVGKKQTLMEMITSFNSKVSANSKQSPTNHQTTLEVPTKTNVNSPVTSFSNHSKGNNDTSYFQVEPRSEEIVNNRACESCGEVVFKSSNENSLKNCVKCMSEYDSSDIIRSMTECGLVDIRAVPERNNFLDAVRYVPQETDEILITNDVVIVDDADADVDNIESHTDTTVDGTNLIDILQNKSSMETFHPEFYFPRHILGNFKQNCAVSVTVSNEALVKFIKDGCPEMEIIKSSTLQQPTKKRILFIGSAGLYCSECRIPFGFLRALKAHFVRAHPDKQFRLPRVIPLSSRTDKECPVCLESFTKIKDLDIHVFTKHRNLPRFKCEKCGDLFARRNNYTNHTKNLEMYGSCNTRQCSICKERFEKDLFKSHFETHRNLECSICKRKFLFAAHLEKHIARHQIAKPTYKKPRGSGELCPVCGKLLYGPLRNHMITHSQTRTFLCDKCPKRFKTKASLKTHLSCVHISGKSFKCSLCDSKTKTISALKYHMRMMHNDEFKKVCPICGLSFKRNDYYKRHLKRHANGTNFTSTRIRKYRSATPNSSTFSCKYCGKFFRGIQLLRLHLLTKHLKNRQRYKCRHCQLTFANVLSRLKHERRHNDPVLFELTCKVCFNQFESKEKLDSHSLKHVGSQRRRCEDCGETFPSKYLLNHHKGEKHFDTESREDERNKLLVDGLRDFLLDSVTTPT